MWGTQSRGLSMTKKIALQNKMDYWRTKNEIVETGYSDSVNSDANLGFAPRSIKIKYVVSETDDFISPRTYEYRFHQILKKSGVDDTNYHALRHTFATRCVAVGVDIKSLSEMLGHSNVAITLNTYVHSSMSMKRIQLEKLSATYTAWLKWSKKQVNICGNARGMGISAF